MRYHQLETTVEEKIKKDRENHLCNPCKTLDEMAVRRDMTKDKNGILRPAYVRDVEKILHLPLYNRYSDKTQVFSFFHNDDITRRGLHVQLVSRIARDIGSLLGLNLDLIEAIALGHDIGHTPFGHAGERFLSELLHRETGRFFNHNVHSTRVLDVMYRRNISLQVLDGILCHNGEFELNMYKPNDGIDFEKYDANVEACYTKGKEAIESLVPSTMEGCVVRISDIIAYIGKDRQDAMIARIIDENLEFSSDYIGNKNAEMINNLIVDIVDHSYGKDYIQMSDKAFSDLKTAKQENNKYIYRNPEIDILYDERIKPMFEELYYKLLADVKKNDKSSVIYKHHIAFVESNFRFYNDFDYRSEEPNQIVADYIASMTDDYFIELHKFLFPNSKYSIEYRSYFED